MSCHGELARRRPEPHYLTLFYLMVSLGGAAAVELVGPEEFRLSDEVDLLRMK